MSKIYKKIGELVDEISMGPFGSDIKVEFFVDHGVPVLNGQNISDFRLKDCFKNYVTKERAAGYKKAIAKRGDIIITHRGTLGQIAYIPDDSEFEEYVISQSQFRVKLKSELVNPIYFTYYFHTDEGQKRLLSFKSHVGVPALAQATTNFRLLDFPIRSKIEQDAVANFLVKIDKKIDLNSHINTELEAMAKTLYDYWFVQFDFPDANGRPYKTSGGKMEHNPILKREIPADWENCKLSELIKLEYGKPLKSENRTGSGYPVFGSSGIVGFHNDYFVEGPGIIIGRKGTVGKVNFAFDNFYPIDTSYYVSSKKEISIIFLYYLISSLGLEFMNSDSAVPGLNRETALGLSVVSAPLELISKYHEYAEVWFEKKKIIINENNELIKLRDWLLPMLMNGQVTVR